MSYSKNEALLHEFVKKLKKMRLRVEEWNQILVAFSNICDYDALLNEYDSMTQQYKIKPNCASFNILMSVRDKNIKQFALDEAKKHVAKHGMREWRKLGHKELKTITTVLNLKF